MWREMWSSRASFHLSPLRYHWEWDLGLGEGFGLAGLEYVRDGFTGFGIYDDTILI